MLDKKKRPYLSPKPGCKLYEMTLWYGMESTSLILEGPEVLDFKDYCYALVPDAARVAMDKKKSEAKADGFHGRIDCSDVVRALMEALESRGFDQVSIPGVSFSMDEWDVAREMNLDEDLARETTLWNDVAAEELHDRLQ